MSRKDRIVHLISLIALIISLFSPVLTLPVTAESEVTEPEVTLIDEQNPLGDDVDTPQEGEQQTGNPGDGDPAPGGEPEPGTGEETESDSVPESEPAPELEQEPEPVAPMPITVMPTGAIISDAVCGDGTVFAQTASAPVTEGLTYVISDPDAAGNFVITATLVDASIYTWAETGLDGWIVDGNSASQSGVVSLCAVVAPESDGDLISEETEPTADELEGDTEPIADEPEGEAEPIVEAPEGDTEPSAEESESDVSTDDGDTDGESAAGDNPSPEVVLEEPTTGRGPARAATMFQTTDVGILATQPEISVSASKTSDVQVGDEIIYTITVTNNTSTDQHYSLVSDLPAGVTFYSHTVPYPLNGDECHYMPGDHEVRCGLAENMVLYSGWADTWTVKVTVNTDIDVAAACLDGLTNTVTGIWGGVASVTSNLPEASCMAPLTLSLVSNAASVEPAVDEASFTITVTNHGITAATDVEVSVQIPPALAAGNWEIPYVGDRGSCAVFSGSTTDIVCDGLTVPARVGATPGTWSVEFYMRAGSNLPTSSCDSTHQLTAALTSSLNSDSAAAAVSIECAVIFDVDYLVSESLTTGPGGLSVVESLEYVVTMTNIGNGSTTIIFGDDLPPDLQYLPVVVFQPGTTWLTLVEDSLIASDGLECDPSLFGVPTCGFASGTTIDVGSSFTFQISYRLNYPSSANLCDVVYAAVAPFGFLDQVRFTSPSNLIQHTPSNPCSATSLFTVDLEISGPTDAVLLNDAFTYTVKITLSDVPDWLDQVPGAIGFRVSLPEGVVFHSVEPDSYFCQAYGIGITTEIACVVQTIFSAGSSNYSVDLNVIATSDSARAICANQLDGERVSGNATATDVQVQIATPGNNVIFNPQVSDSVSTDIECETSLSLDVVADKSSVAEGEVVTYTVTVTNNGPAINEGYSFYAAVNANGIGAGAYPGPSQAVCETYMFTIICTSSRVLLPGGTHTYQIMVEADLDSPQACTRLEMRFFGTGGLHWDEASSESAGIEHETGINCQDLYLATVTGAQPIVEGTPFTYTVYVGNLGSSANGPYAFTVTLPAGVDLERPLAITSPDGAACTPMRSGGTTSISCTSQNGPPAPSINEHVYTFQVVADSDINSDVCGLVTWSVRGDTGRFNINGNFRSSSHSVICFSVSIAAPAITENTQEPTITLTLKNGGSTPITVPWVGLGLEGAGSSFEQNSWSAVVAGIASEECEQSSALGSTILTCEDVVIPARDDNGRGETTIVWTHPAMVETAFVCGNYPLFAALSNDGVEFDASAEGTLSMTCGASLSITKVVDKEPAEPAEPGDTLTYTVTVTNNGTIAEDAYAFTDTLPAGVILEGDLPTGCTKPDNSDVITCARTNLGVGTASAHEFRYAVEVTGEVCTSVTNSVAGTIGAWMDGDDQDSVTTTIECPFFPTVTIASATCGEGTPQDHTLAFSEVSISSLSLAYVYLNGSGTPEQNYQESWTFPWDEPSSISVAFSYSGTESIPELPVVEGGTWRKASETWIYFDASFSSINCEPELQITKTQVSYDNESGIVAVDPGDEIHPGDYIAYEIEVTNEGGTSLDQVTIVDTPPVGTSQVAIISGSANLSCEISPITQLASCDLIGELEPQDQQPGNVVKAVFLVRVDSDIAYEICSIHNTAEIRYVVAADGTVLLNTERGGILDNPIVSNSVDTSVVCANPALNFRKNVDRTEAEPGDTLTYSIYLENESDNTEQIGMEDHLPDGVSFQNYSIWAYPLDDFDGGNQASSPPCEVTNGRVLCDPDSPTVDVLPGWGFKYEISVTVNNDADCDSELVNTATGRQGWAGHSGSATTTVTCSPLLSIEKSVSPTTPVEPGDTLAYTVTVTNSGTAEEDEYSFIDTLPTGVEIVAGSWDDDRCEVAGQAITCEGEDIGLGEGFNQHTFSYSVTVGAETCDDIVNDVAGELGAWDEVASTDSVTTEIECDAGITITKTGPANVDPGGAIRYTITLENTGNIPVHQVDVTDDIDVPFASGWSVTSPTGVECEIDSSNSLGCDPFTLPLTPAYEFVISGTVTSDPDPADCADSAYNTASVSGSTAEGDVDDESDVVQTDLDCTAGIKVTKTDSIGEDDSVAPGGSFGYTITLENTGNISLKNLVLTDIVPTGTAFGSWIDKDGLDCDDTVTCSLAELPAHETRELTFSAQVLTNLSAEVCDDGIVNHVSVGGSSSLGNRNDASTVTTSVECLPAYSFAKTGPSQVIPGETIWYEITLANTGNIDIGIATLTDELPVLPAGGSWTVTRYGAPYSFDDAVTSITPGSDPVVIRIESSVIPADITTDSAWCGEWENTGSVAGSFSNNTELDATDSATVRVNCTGLSIVQEVNAPRITPGEQVEYTITVTNRGNTAVSPMIVYHNASQTGGVFSNWSVSSDHENLLDCGLVEDIDPGCTYLLLNPEDSVAITITGDAPMIPTWEQCAPVESQAVFIYGEALLPMQTLVVLSPPYTPITSNTVTTQIDCQPGVEITKSGEVDTGDDLRVDAGDVITYSIEVTNSGNLNLYDIVVADEMSGITWDSDLTIAQLDPGETETLTGTYLVSQDDIDHGEISNSASVTAMLVPAVDDYDDAGTEVGEMRIAVTAEEPDPIVSVSAFAEVTITTAIQQEPGISLEKSSVADTGDDDVLNIDESITYSFIITNTGNVTLTDVTVVDEMEGVTFDDETTIASLAPGAAITLTASYTVTQADVDSGIIVNCADVGGTAPDASTVQDLDTCATDLIDQNPALAIVWGCQDPTADWLPDVGDTATFKIMVTNSGDQTVHQILMETSREGVLDSDFPTTLAPGESATRIWTATVSQADFDARTVDVTVTFTGETEAGAAAMLASAVAMQADSSVSATVSMSCPMADLPVIPPPATPDPPPTGTATPDATPSPTATPGATPAEVVDPTTEAVTGLPSTGHGTGTVIPLLVAAAMVSIIALVGCSLGIRRRHG